jgi:rod shape-determining protein MreC
MRDLFRFLFRQRDNLLFLLLLSIAMTLVVNWNMHQRAQTISSSNRVIAGIYGFRNGVTEFASLREVNRDLAEQLAKERERNRAVIIEHDSLGMQVDTVRQLRYRFLTAQVINSTTHKEKNYVTLDKGSDDGIRENMGVIGAKGIVGVVWSVTPHFSSVISVLNIDHAASAQLHGTKHFGQLRWDTHDPHTIHLADIDKHVPVHVGDTVETRGSERVYPEGILVGQVESVANDPSIPFHVITVRLSEDLTRSGYVHVVSDLMRKELEVLDSLQQAGAK